MGRVGGDESLSGNVTDSGHVELGEGGKGEGGSYKEPEQLANPPADHTLQPSPIVKHRPGPDEHRSAKAAAGRPPAGHTVRLAKSNSTRQPPPHQPTKTRLIGSPDKSSTQA